MSNFHIVLSEDVLFMSGLKLTLLFSLLWLVYLGMPNVSPLWKSRFWRVGSVLTVLVLLLSLSPPQLKVEVARPTATHEVQYTESEFLAAVPLEDEAETQVASAQLESRDDSAALILPRTPQPIELRHVLTGVWLAGVFVFLLRWLMVVMRTWRICRLRDPVEDSVIGILPQLARRLGIRNVPPVFRADTASPCLAYCPSPVILLPKDFDVGSEQAISAVFAHELVHLKRFDWFWNVAFGMMETLLWFHPLVWKIRSTHLGDCENACDDLAAEISGGRPAYQQVLAQVALDRANGSAAVGLSMVRKAEIVRRLIRLDVPVADFSLKKLISVLATTTFLVSVISTIGIAVIDDNSAADKASENENEFSIQIPLEPDELKQTTVQMQWYFSEAKKPVRRKMVPDAEGWVRGAMGEGSLSSVTIVCRAPGYVPFAITRHARNRKIVLPVEEMIELEEGRFLSGVVVDSEGNPVEGALAELGMKSQDSWDSVRHFDLANVKTDHNGRWSIPNAPWALKAAHVNIKVSHSDYLAAWASVPEYPKPDLISKVKLSRGVNLKGSVVDVDGRPINGVRVTLGYQSGVLPRPPEDVTDSDGKFELTKCRTGSRFLVATRSGFAPELIELNVTEKKADTADIRVMLKPGKTIRARLVDQHGLPVKDAWVGIQHWRKDHSLGFNTRTDDEGRFEWHDAPHDPVSFTFVGEKHRLIVFHELQHSDEEHEVLLYTTQTVRVKLVDAETGEIVRDAHGMRGLRFFPDRDGASWDGSWTPFIDGEVEYTFRRSVPETWLKIRAPGYRIRIEKFKLGEDDKDVTLKLQPGAFEEDEDWEPVRNRIRNGDVPMEKEAAAIHLKKLGAEVGQSDGVWRIRIVGSLAIPSAMFGVPNIIEEPGKGQWKGETLDFERLGGFEKVDLTIDGFHLDGDLLKTLAETNSIVSLNVDSCSLELSAEECQRFGDLKSLRVLKLDGHWQKFPPEVVEALAELPKLESLVFDGVGAYHMDEETFADRLSKLKHLKHLALNNDGGFQNEIGKELSQLKQLQSLSVRGRQMSDEFIDQISELPLRKLNLAMTGITDVGLRKIANSFPELEELVVERTGVTKDGIRSVMDQFGSLRKLTVEAQLGEVLIEFKRRHIDCVIMPIGYERGSVWWSGPLELPKEKKD